MIAEINFGINFGINLVMNTVAVGIFFTITD